MNLVAATLAAGNGRNRGLGNANEVETLVAPALRAQPNDPHREDLMAYVLAPPLTSNPYGDHESREGLLVAPHGDLAAYGGNQTSGARKTAAALNAKGGSGRMDFESETFVMMTGQPNQNGSGISEDVTFTLDQSNRQAIAHTLCGEGFDASEDGTGRGAPLVFTERGRAGGAALETQEDKAFGLRSGRAGRPGDGVATSHGVRRLSPTEYERLQGFPDAWTCLCGRNAGRSIGADPCRCKDGPRYRAIGNAVPVPVVEWLLRRLML